MPPRPPNAPRRPAGGAGTARGPVPSPRRQTVSELRDLQRLALKSITRPLTPGHAMQRTWDDGRPTDEVVAAFIKPNDRLTSFERIEIYNKQYWFRLLDCLYDDYPGLRAVLGERKFDRLRKAYLTKYPSQSFTLRNLGRRLVQFLTDEPQYASPHERMAVDMARFEWAQVVAFDEAALPALSIDDLLGQDPAKLRLALQPHITLLELGYPLDDYVLEVKKQAAEPGSTASNAVDPDAGPRPARPGAALRRPRPERVFLAVHRLDNTLYYKRLEPEAYTILCALRDGRTLARACVAAIDRSDRPDGAWTGEIPNWFNAWTRFGWFCHVGR